MSARFTSLPNHPRYQLLDAWGEIFPGIERVVVLFRTDTGETGGHELIMSGNIYRSRELLLDGFNDKFLQIVKETSGYSWLNRQQVPFEQGEIVNGQRELFSEKQHVVLLLRIKRSQNDAVDLHYLYFREDQTNFGISRLEGSLDTSRKALVGNLLFRFVRLFYRSTEESLDYFKQFTNVTRELLGSYQSGTGSKFQSTGWIKQWAEDLLTEIAEPSDIRLKLSQEALQKLSDAHDYHAAKKALERAAKFALMLFSDSQQEEVVIEHSYISIEKPADNFADSHNMPVSQSRLNKTALFLDKLENAAQKLIQSGEDITSSAVGQTMERPVSAPAITDALRKNRQRVILLLQQNPSRWQIIRKHFRPLINIVEKENNLRNTG